MPSAVTSAYGRTSWPYQLICGSAANTSPANSPARGETNRRPIAVRPAAAAAIASADGSRVAVSPVPASRTSAHIIM